MSRLKGNAALLRAMEYLLERYSERVTLGDLARVSGLSRFHLLRTFARRYGFTPHAFQIQVRIARARELIGRGVPVAQAGMQTGFADQSHFTRHFKKIWLMTPGEYARVR